MLNILTRIANRLKPAQHILYACLLFLFLLLVYLVIVPSQTGDKANNPVMLLVFLSLMWGLLINLLIHSFAGEVLKAQEKRSLIQKLKQRIKKAVSWLLMLIFIGLTLAIMITTFRLLNSAL